MKFRVPDSLLNLPILVKVTGIALGTALVLGAVLFYQIRHSYYRIETEEVEENALFSARILASAAAPFVRSGDLAEVQRLVEEIARTSNTINEVRVQDSNGRVLARLGPLDPKTPVFEGTSELEPGRTGKAIVAMNYDHIHFEMGWHTRRIFVTTGILVIAGFLVTSRLMRVVIEPVHELVNIARQAKDGNYRRRAAIRARDEIGELATAFNDAMIALQQKDAANRQLRRKIVAAEEEERKRIARELHDHAGQTLTSLIAGLAVLESEAPNPKLAELRAVAAQTLDEVHDLSLALRPAALEDLGLVSALQKLCAGFCQRFGVKVDCAAVGFENNHRLAGEIEAALYRITQEALTNAVRHGRARSVDVLLQRRLSSILAVIEDDGQGFATQEWRARCLRDDHLGLLGIEERATLLGGTLRVESSPNAGTSLFVEIPLGINGDE